MTDPYRCLLNRFALVIGLLSIVSPVVGQNIDTYAGTGTAGYSGDGGPAISAMLNTPAGLAVAANGDFYFADRINGVVRGRRGGRSTAIQGGGARHESAD